MYKKALLEKREYVYIKRILTILEYTEDITSRTDVSQWHYKLDNAIIVDADMLPLNIIRCYSIVYLKFDNGSTKKLQLVIPAEANTKNNKVSVLSPIGMALLGNAQGDNITYVPKSKKECFSIVKVAQDAEQYV